MLTGTKRLLERAGFTVITAANGALALELFTEHPSIGLVILDMSMPVMSGAECFRKIRERSDVPVLIATGYAVDAEVQALVAQGAALIEKPYRATELMPLVERLLAQMPQLLAWSSSQSPALSVQSLAVFAASSDRAMASS